MARRGARLAVLAATASIFLATPAGTSAAPTYPTVAEQTDVPIVMSDGTKLFADLYRPGDNSGQPVGGKFPVVVTLTPYNKSAGVAVSASDLVVRHGYIQAIVDVRGTGSSEGEWTSWGPDERRDAYDVMTWASQQPFSDGRTAMVGTSYMAISQYFAAAQHPPGLKALFTVVPMEDAYRDITWHAGNINAGFIPFWLGLVDALKLVPPGYTASDPAEALKVLSQRATTGLNFTATAVAGGALGEQENAYDGPFYEQRSPRSVVSKVDVPTFVVGGWYDLFQRGSTRLFGELPLPDSQKKLIVGPWYHVTAGEGLGASGAPPALDNLYLAWFDHWVKGVDNGIDRFPSVSLYQLGADKWEQYESWPPPSIEWRRLYLSGETSGSADSLNDGTLSPSPPAAAGSNSGELNAVNGVCTRSLVQWTAGLARVPDCETDNRLQELTSFTYTTPPMERALHIAGPIGLTLRGSSTRPDANWTATVTDVAPDGTSSQVTAGWLRTAMRALLPTGTVHAPNGDVVVPFHPFTKASETMLDPGTVATLNIEIFNTDLVVEPGHRLRLTISSGDLPNQLATLPTFANTAGQVNTVHWSPSEPSFLTLPVVGPVLPKPLARLRLHVRARAWSNVRGRRLSVTVKTVGGAVQGLVLSLRGRRGKVVGRSRPVDVAEKARIIVRTRRALRPGAYTLVARGRMADGRTVTAKTKLLLAKKTGR